MRLFYILIPILSLLLPVTDMFAQNQQSRIDSLIRLLKTAGREWNDYSIPLIEIGEPAVQALIEVAKDRRLEQWNRRITVMTLNEIHSPKWKEPALSILFDPAEDPVLRNHVTAGLKGFELSDVKEALWRRYEEVTNENYKLNIAYLLLTADTSMAYRSFKELYKICDGYVQKSALMNLVLLRPHESTMWYLDGLRIDDWMTANMAMDSLVVSRNFIPDRLIELYRNPDLSEEVKWRIIYVFGHRSEPELIPMLVVALKEESWLVHTEAAVGLCRFDPELVIPEMEKFKNSSETFIRNNSRWVIRQIKEQ